MLRIVEETVRASTPHFLGIEPGDELPQADPQSSVDSFKTFGEIGGWEFSLILSIAFLLLNLVSLVIKGRTFPRLDYGVQSELVERLCNSNSSLVMAMLMIMTVPIMWAYYGRTDVEKTMGFDTVALKEESELRRVTRDGGPLPPKTSETGADARGSQEPTGEEVPAKEVQG